ncbi:MAG TPA: ECF-type sigma factor [Thermoanaerobaculia bacterium]|nr:ECF-type sigma factor [Thermoanaerobaculia bacterium]
MPGTEVTGLLQAWRRGDASAGDLLLDRVYVELRKIASAQLRGERAGHTLQPTALVHEAYLRLLAQQRVDWRDRAHFFGLAAAMMRRVLVDHARARAARKRQAGDEISITLVLKRQREVDLLDLDRALDAFAERYPRQAKVVEMRYFADLEHEEVAECLGVSTITIKRDWQFARVWLRAHLDGDGGGEGEASGAATRTTPSVLA